MFMINNVPWSIIAVPKNDDRLYRGDGSLSVASCDEDTHCIYINNELQGAFLRKVLCHEITHAAMFSYNITLSLDQEELLADLIATYGSEIIDVTNKVFSKIKNGLQM